MAQTGLRADHSLYLTAAEAAARLKVAIPTIYAYVSRKMIRAQRVTGAHRSLYWKADIDRLAGVETPLSSITLVESSELTLLTGAGHYYRGRSALDLARTETLESVAGVLWGVDAEAAFGAAAPRFPAGYREMTSGDHVGGGSLQRAILALSLVELENPRSYDLSRVGYANSGAHVVRLVAAALLGAEAPSAEPLHDFIVRQFDAPTACADLVRRLLVLAADHELDPTAYAVRAAANTGVTPYAATIAGLVSSSGRRLPFGRAESLTRFFEEIMDGVDPGAAVLQRLREGERLPGFASDTYPDGDPRALSLLASLRQAFGSDADFRNLDAAISVAHEAIGARPAFILPAVYLGRKVGLRAEHGGLIRLARVVGWIAHAMEQFEGNKLVRPHTAYDGRLPALHA